VLLLTLRFWGTLWENAIKPYLVLPAALNPFRQT